MENKLREIRQRRGLPMLGLSVQAHVSTATLSAVEKWGYVPRDGVRQRIADVLGVTAVEIWPTLLEKAEVHGLPASPANV